MCVCMYACMYVYMYVCMCVYVCVYVCMCVYVCIMYACMYVCMYVCMHTLECDMMLVWRLLLASVSWSVIVSVPLFPSVGVSLTKTDTSAVPLIDVLNRLEGATTGWGMGLYVL